MKPGHIVRNKYLIEEKLGEGGMASVWRARHLRVDRHVAIKVLHPSFVANPTVAKRFLQEAKAAFSIDHVNVVKVIDIDEDDDGTPYIVQEMLVGEDLDARFVRTGRLTPKELIALMIPVLSALDGVHARGVVHRDLKPSNIFLAEGADGVVPKVLDFGISRVISDDPRLTATGIMMGTPAYMSPEQALSPRSVDARTDLWAVGIMCYELLSGVLPFEADSPAQLMVAIAASEPRPLCDAAPDVPPVLASLVMSCLRRNVNDRPRSAAVLLAALRALSDDELHPVATRAPSLIPVVGAAREAVTEIIAAPVVIPSLPPPRPRAPIARNLAVFAVLTLLTGLTVHALRAPRVAPPHTAAAPPMRTRVTPTADAAVPGRTP